MLEAQRHRSAMSLLPSCASRSIVPEQMQHWRFDEKISAATFTAIQESRHTPFERQSALGHSVPLLTVPSSHRKSQSSRADLTDRLTGEARSLP